MLRKIHQMDLMDLLQIEQSTHIDPWDEAAFRTCFNAGCLGWVAIINSRIIGFIINSIKVNECHILNLGVLTAYQHQGYGRKLLEKALSDAIQSRVGIAYLEVRRSNHKAISLYRKLHFIQIGERKNYYPLAQGRAEDALIFAKDLSDSSGM